MTLTEAGYQIVGTLAVPVGMVVFCLLWIFAGWLTDKLRKWWP